MSPSAFCTQNRLLRFRRAFPGASFTSLPLLFPSPPDTIPIGIKRLSPTASYPHAPSRQTGYSQTAQGAVDTPLIVRR